MQEEFYQSGVWRVELWRKFAMRISFGFVFLLTKAHKSCRIVSELLQSNSRRVPQTVAVAFPNREVADSFCLPEGGGDAHVRYLGAIVPVRRIFSSTFDLHR